MARCEYITSSAMLALRPASWTEKYNLLNLQLFSSVKIIRDNVPLPQWVVAKCIKVHNLMKITEYRVSGASGCA